MRIGKSGKLLGSVLWNAVPDSHPEKKSQKKSLKEVESVAKERAEAPDKTAEEFAVAREEMASAGSEREAVEEPQAEAPAKSDPKQDWVEYAVGQGYDREEVESLTKAELVEQFGE